MVSTNDHIFYAEMTPAEFEKRLQAAPIAYLPLGTLEWHGPHLPLGSDGLQSQGFFVELSSRVGGIILPMLFLGPDQRQIIEGQEFFGMDVFGFIDKKPEQLTGSTYWIEDDLFKALLERILANLARAGFKIVVAHGHGPSTTFFAENILQWQDRFGLKLFHCLRAHEEDNLGLQIDHAAANETSLMMAFNPDLVHMENLPIDAREWPKAILGKDPRLFASPQYGHHVVRFQLERMEKLLRAALAPEID